MTLAITIMGECMLELSSRQSQMALPGDVTLSYGGDTLNTAVYLSRLGVATGYLSALGTDPHSQALLACWQQEKVNCEQVIELDSHLPGMYAIQTDDSGERSFYYWRENSAARHLFTDDALFFSHLNKVDSDYFYLSGITLALLNDSTRNILFSFLKDYRNDGGTVVFDSNYRVNLWPDQAEARRVFGQMYDLTDIALPTYDDELLLRPGISIEQCIGIFKVHGVRELILKCGTDGVVIANEEGIQKVPLQKVVKATDTTAAGDSFNAGYLAALIQGKSTVGAVRHGQQLAATVVQHPGAIIPLDKMPFTANEQE